MGEGPNRTSKGLPHRNRVEVLSMGHTWAPLVEGYSAPFHRRGSGVPHRGVFPEVAPHPGASSASAQK